MLRYLHVQEVFQEVPNEMSLAIAISGCTIRCTGCHSRELWEDKGLPLTIECLEVLLQEHKGITCLLLLGGEHDIDALTELFMFAHRRVKTAWYSGYDTVPRKNHGIYQYLDFIKLGHFDLELGGLDSPATNQRLYKIDHQENHYQRTDITHLFWKDNRQNTTPQELDCNP